MPSSPTRLPERPVYQSLVRVPRYAGVDRSFLVLEVTLVVCLVYLMGISVASVVVVAVVAALVAFVLVGLPRSGDAADPSLWRVAGTAAVAINAMILPGVSGAFLLEVLGLYRPTLEALRGLDIPYVLAFMGGAGVGLGLAAKGLSWLLDRYHDWTMAVLVGLLAGSLRALWPWVATIDRVSSDGTVEVVPDPSVLLAPGSEWPVALGLALLGFAFVTGLAWVGRKRLGHGDEILAAEHDQIHAE